MKSKLLLLVFLTLGISTVDSAVDQIKAEQLERMLNDSMRLAPNETFDAYRARRRRVILAHDVAMKNESLGRVMGAVKHPAYFEIKKGLKVGDVILAAGGFTKESSHWRVMITRIDEKGEKKSIEISFSAQIPSQNEIDHSPEILPGDMIFALEIA